MNAANSFQHHKKQQSKDNTNPCFSSDVLHPGRPNVSKDELRSKLSELYKSSKDQVSCFGFRTQYGGGKSTGFALIYDSAEAMKKFEPRYRLIRYGQATKIERASRQQREYTEPTNTVVEQRGLTVRVNRQAEKESPEGAPRYREGEGSWQGQEEIKDLRIRWSSGLRTLSTCWCITCMLASLDAVATSTG